MTRDVNEKIRIIRSTNNLTCFFACFVQWRPVPSFCATPFLYIFGHSFVDQRYKPGEIAIKASVSCNILWESFRKVFAY